MVSIGPVPRAGQDPSGPVDTVFQSVFRQFGRAVDAQPAVNRIHPTAKPVELIERALLNASKAGDVVSETVKHRLQTCALLLRVRSFGGLHQVAGTDPLCEGRLHLDRGSWPGTVACLFFRVQTLDNHSGYNVPRAPASWSGGGKGVPCLSITFDGCNYGFVAAIPSLRSANTDFPLQTPGSSLHAGDA